MYYNLIDTYLPILFITTFNPNYVFSHIFTILSIPFGPKLVRIASATARKIIQIHYKLYITQILIHDNKHNDKMC